MIRLSLVSVGMVEDSSSVVLILRAPELARLLVLQVGLLEGRAIAMEAEGVKPPRPLTHELTTQIIDRLGARVREVNIRDYQDQVFFADLVVEQANGDVITLDARPSDAIALALRSGASISASEQVMAAAGIEEDGDEELIDPELAEDDEDEDDGSENVVH